MIGSTFKYFFYKKKINLNNVHENTPTINLKIEIKRCLMPTAKPNSSMFLFFQLRVKTDGLAKGSPGVSAGGAIFRAFNGTFQGGFAMPLGHQTSFFMLYMPLLQPLTLLNPIKRHWIWMKADSTSVLVCFQSSHCKPPW